MDPNSRVSPGEEKPPNTVLAASQLRRDVDSAADRFQHPFARDADGNYICNATRTLKKIRLSFQMRHY